MRNVDTVKINRNKRTVRASLTVFMVLCQVLGWGDFSAHFLFIIFFLKFFYLLCYYDICINCYRHYNIYKEKDKEQLCITCKYCNIDCSNQTENKYKKQYYCKNSLHFIPSYSSICKVSSSQSAISLSSLSSRASFCF